MNAAALPRIGNYSLFDKKSIFDTIARDWMPHLNLSEVAFVLWVSSNTISRGRERGTYTLGQLERGVRRAGGGWWTSGTGMTRNTLRKCIHHLTEIGALFSECTEKGYVLSINTSWDAGRSSSVIEFPNKNKKLSLKRQVREGGSNIDPEGVPNFDPHGGETLTPSKKNQQGGTTKEESLPAQAPELKAVIEKVAESHRGKDKPPLKENLLGWEKAWQSGFRSQFEKIHIPPWTRKEGYMVKAVMKKYPDGVKFIEWVSCNWLHIMRVNFSWMKRPPAPEIPTIGFFCKFISRFYDAYVSEDQGKFIGDAKGAEKRIQHKIYLGMTREQAIYEVAKEDAVAGDREKRQADIETAQRYYRMAEMAKKNATDMVRRGEFAQARKKQEQESKAQPRVIVPEDGVGLEDLPEDFDPEKFA